MPIDSQSPLPAPAPPWALAGRLARARLDRESQERLRDLVNQEMEAAFGAARGALWWIDADAAARTEQIVRSCLDRVIREQSNSPGFILPSLPELVVQRQIDDLIGLGPLHGLFRHPAIEGIQINGDQVFVMVDGELRHVDVPLFESETDVLAMIQGVIQRLGQTITPATPDLTTMLPDSSRLTVVVPPITPFVSITIRLHTLKDVTLDDLVTEGMLPAGAAAFLRTVTRARLNILITGPTGSGKTTLARALAAEYADSPELIRVVTVEDNPELQLINLLPNCVPMTVRKANDEGHGAKTMRELVSLAMRMDPQVLIVGEVRGPEALDLLQAMNTGHSGGITTFHANSAEHGLWRFAVMAAQAAEHLPLELLQSMIGDCVHLIVHVGRRPGDGRRAVLEIYEIVEVRDGRDVIGHYLWSFVEGSLRRTALSPEKTCERLLAKGVPVIRTQWEVA